MRGFMVKIKTFFILSSLLVILFGCKKENDVVSIAIDESSIPAEVLVSEFDVATIKLILTYKNGDRLTIDLEPEMISSSDRLKLSTSGNHTITVTYQTFTTSFSITLIADVIEFQLANGLYDLSYLPDEEKAGILAAMEGYLMETMYGGIPLYSFAQKVIFSPRVDLLYDHYHHMLGFSLAHATLTQDDAASLFYPDIYGSTGSYTFRSAVTYEPPTLHPSYGNDTVTNHMLELLSGSLYKKVYNETHQGYDIIPGLASGYPIPTSGEMIHGKITSNQWTITVKDHLKWQIPDGVTVTDDQITAEDFVWTFKQAIIHSWPLAVSGLYSLKNMDLINVDEYEDGIRSIDEIGITSTSNLTIQFRFNRPKTEDELLSYLSQISFSPVHREMYEDVTSDYGTSKNTTPSAGLFYLSEWIHGDKVVFESNPCHPDYDELSLTGFHYRILSNQQAIYDAFLVGELDMAYVPATYLSNHPLNEHTIMQPSPYVWRLGINSLGTPELRDAYIDKHPELKLSNPYEPEPILMYQEMRQALYYAIDRLTMTGDGLMEFLPEGMVLSSQFYLSPYSHISYRDHEDASSLANEFLKDNYGFDVARATSLFKEAIGDAIDDGYYEAGTASNPTTITIYLNYESGYNTRITAMMESLENMVETYLVDDTHHVNVDLVLQNIAFPCCSTPPLRLGSFDLYLGAISGSLLDLPTYMETMRDDAFLSYPLNIGVNTTSPTIEISYTNHENTLVHERWSFNALVDALSGPIYIKDGNLQETFDTPSDLILALYTKERQILTYETTENQAFIPILKGQSTTSLATSLGVDEVYGLIASYTDDAEYFILTKDEGQYKLYERFKIYADVNEAVETFVQENYGMYNLISLSPILTDEALQQDPYLSEWYNFETLSELADEYDVSLEYMKVYSATWSIYSGSSWSDVIILVKIDDYYLPIVWL